jgi:hypothetical protein
MNHGIERIISGTLEGITDWTGRKLDFNNL